MTDNQLFTLVRGILMAQMPARGMPLDPAPGGWRVERKYQPTQQGVNSSPTVYLFKLFDKRHGSPQQLNQWSAADQVVNLAESQQMETSFQASIRMDEGTDPNALTPGDAANNVAAIMQSDAGLAALRAANVGIFRIADVRNPYNTDDRDRFAADPSFDFVLTHRRGYQGTTPHAVSVQGSFNRV